MEDSKPTHAQTDTPPAEPALPPPATKDPDQKHESQSQNESNQKSKDEEQNINKNEQAVDEKAAEKDQAAKEPQVSPLEGEQKEEELVVRPKKKANRKKQVNLEEIDLQVKEVMTGLKEAIEKDIENAKKNEKGLLISAQQAGRFCLAREQAQLEGLLREVSRGRRTRPARGLPKANAEWLLSKLQLQKQSAGCAEEFAGSAGASESDGGRVFAGESRKIGRGIARKPEADHDDQTEVDADRHEHSGELHESRK